MIEIKHEIKDQNIRVDATANDIRTINRLVCMSVGSEKFALRALPCEIFRSGPVAIKVEYEDGIWSRVYGGGDEVRTVVGGGALILCGDLNCRLETFIDQRIARKELKAILDRWAERGWAAHWCDSCGCHVFHCKICQANACRGGTKDCDDCKIAYQQSELLWNETDDLAHQAANGKPPYTL